MSALKESALSLASRGLFIFPLAAGTKIPIRGTHGYKSATRDAAQISDWWGRFPLANVAIATGRSGLVVIDVDVKRGVNGFDGLASLIEELGELPGPTKQAGTPSGGAHFFFRTDAKLKGGEVAPGVDLLPNQCTAAPSVIDGKSYEWTISNVPTAELPARWVERFKPVPYTAPESPSEAPKNLERYLQSAVDREVEELLGSAEGTRNQALCRFAFVLGTLSELPTEAIRTAAQSVFDRWDWAHAKPNHRKSVNTLERGIKEGRLRPRERR